MYSRFYESKKFFGCSMSRETSQLEKTRDTENLFFKARANRFWLTSISYSWFNKVVHDQPSTKQTSLKGK